VKKNLKGKGKLANDLDLIMTKQRSINGENGQNNDM
jgi:hypothetical protein